MVGHVFASHNHAYRSADYHFLPFWIVLIALTILPSIFTRITNMQMKRRHFISTLAAYSCVHSLRPLSLLASNDATDASHFSDLSDEELEVLLNAAARVNHSAANPYTDSQLCARQLMNMALIGSVAKGNLDLGLFENREKTVNRLIEDGKLHDPSQYAYFPSLLTSESKDDAKDALSSSLAKSTLSTTLSFISPPSSLAMKLVAAWLPDIATSIGKQGALPDKLLVNVQDASFLEKVARIAAIESRDLAKICPEALKLDFSKIPFASTDSAAFSTKAAESLRNKIKYTVAKAATSSEARDQLLKELRLAISTLVVEHYAEAKKAAAVQWLRQAESEVDGISICAGFVLGKLIDEKTGAMIQTGIQSLSKAWSAFEHFSSVKDIGVKALTGNVLSAGLSLISAFGSADDATLSALKQISAQIASLSKQVSEVYYLQIQTLQFLERSFAEVLGHIASIEQTLDSIRSELGRMHEHLVAISSNTLWTDLKGLEGRIRAGAVHNAYDFKETAELVHFGDMVSSNPAVTGYVEPFANFKSLGASLNDYNNASAKLAALRPICNLVGLSGIDVPERAFNPEFWAEASRAYLTTRLQALNKVEPDDESYCRRLFSKGLVWRNAILKVNKACVEAALSKWDDLAGCALQGRKQDSFAGWVASAHEAYSKTNHYNGYKTRESEISFDGPEHSHRWSTGEKRISPLVKATQYIYNTPPIFVDDSPVDIAVSRGILKAETIWSREAMHDPGNDKVVLFRWRLIIQKGPQHGKQLGHDILSHHVVPGGKVYYIHDYNPSADDMNSHGKNPVELFELCKEQLKLDDLVKDISGFPDHLSKRLTEYSLPALYGSARAVQFLGALLAARCRTSEDEAEGPYLGDICMPTSELQLAEVVRQAMKEREARGGKVSVADGVSSILKSIRQAVLRNLAQPEEARSLPVLDQTLRELSAFAITQGLRLEH